MKEFRGKIKEVYGDDDNPSGVLRFSKAIGMSKNNVFLLLKNPKQMGLKYMPIMAQALNMSLVEFVTMIEKQLK